MNNVLLEEATLKIGEVSGIEGRRIFVTLNKNKNTSDILFNGDLLKNVSVGSYVEIKKGFIGIIGKVDGEKLSEDKINQKDSPYEATDLNKRTLTMSLSGYINIKGEFTNGIKELPLIGNEAFILTNDKLHKIHNLVKKNSKFTIRIAKTEIEELPINFPIDGLFNSHIAIFGNTGSGKSNTLASLYQAMICKIHKYDDFIKKCRILIFDFNGEYSEDDCVTKEKTVYNLSTKSNSVGIIPISFEEFMDIETISILLEATEKTQKPFLKRTLRNFKYAKDTNNSKKPFPAYLITLLEESVINVLKSDKKEIAMRILEYLVDILVLINNKIEIKKLFEDLKFHETYKYFYHYKNEPSRYDQNCRYKSYDYAFFNNEAFNSQTNIYKSIGEITDVSIRNLECLDQFFIFLLLQLISDLNRYRVQLDHILPVINRFKAKQKDIEKIFRVDGENKSLWGESNVVIINLRNVNIDMRKTIPLLLAKQEYKKHKEKDNKASLSIIIDEAHNILSKSSFRETEDWKDYRLETFEEIIKEGRKFGVFVTIASQRPNDISETIISQVHNYFIHQLVNQRDLQTIGNAVSYIDKLTEESIPTLPVGTCIFSGISTPMPLRLIIDELPDKNKPKSNTLKFSDIINVTKK